jgi:DNA-binding PadR family transcriptional regulator
MSTRDERIELLQGTLDLLILRTLQPGPAHGHAIAKAIERPQPCAAGGAGSLYPAPSAAEAWLDRCEDGTSENNRCTGFHRLTPKGRKQLSIETAVGPPDAAIARILHQAGENI